MKRSLIFCAIALVAMAANTVRADGITIGLDYDTGAMTWELYGAVDDDGGTDGDIGLSAVRLVATGLDFTPANVTFAAGNGQLTINPVQLLGGGPIGEVLYGQDISLSGTVVAGVGVGGRSLLASGALSSASAPAFATDPTGGGGLTSQGLFLTCGTPGCGNAVDPSGAIVLALNDVGGEGIFGDFEPDGDVDIIDFGLFADAFGSMTADGNYDVRADEEPDGDVDIIDFGKFADNFGIGTASSLSTVPEPTSALLAALALVSLGTVRRRS